MPPPFQKVLEKVADSTKLVPLASEADFAPMEKSLDPPLLPATIGYVQRNEIIVLEVGSMPQNLFVCRGVFSPPRILSRR